MSNVHVSNSKNADSLLHNKEKELSDLLTKDRQNPNLDLRDKIDSVLLELTFCLRTKVEKSLRWTQASFYTLKDIGL